MKKPMLFKAFAITLLALILLSAALILLWRDEQGKYSERRTEMSAGFGQLKVVEWNGKVYREKPAVTTMLIVGVDKNGEDSPNISSTNKYRNGGQADFLLLMAIDHTEKKVHQLQIDRDTITDVYVLGVFGNEVGTRKLQICLSHSFGATPQDSAKYTVRAVQNLLDGAEIDGYYVFNYNAVPLINDMLGGVTVKLDYDMTSVHPQWTKGSAITLHGKEAEDFVRQRMAVGHGTNEERMDRQNEFIRNVISLMKQKLSEDFEFGETILTTLNDLATSNMTAKQLIEEMNKAYQYEVMPIDHPNGEYTLSSDGYIEFHMHEDAAVEWIMDHLYTDV